MFRGRMSNISDSPAELEKGSIHDVGSQAKAHAALLVSREPKLKQALKGKAVYRLKLSNENLLSTDDPVNALVPILVGGVPAAVIVLFRLFPHKPGIEAVD